MVWLAVIAGVVVWITVIGLAWMLCIAVARGERQTRDDAGNPLGARPGRRRFRRPAA